MSDFPTIYYTETNGEVYVYADSGDNGDYVIYGMYYNIYDPVTNTTVTTNVIPFDDYPYSGLDVNNSANETILMTVTYYSPPSAPTIISAFKGDTKATINWSPATPNGYPITGYTIYLYDSSDVLLGQQTVSGSTYTYTYTGLTNGVSYKFKVSATNENGEGLLSEFSSIVIPSVDGIPDSPVIYNVTAYNGQVYVDWSTPYDNGSAITQYTVYVYLSNGTYTGTSTNTAFNSIYVTGLVNGTSYKFTVSATNGVGESSQSAFSSIVTPTDNVPCFPKGCNILTQRGYVPIETINPNDKIITSDGRQVTFSVYRTKIKATQNTAPYIIPAGCIAQNFPMKDLRLSPNHAFYLGNDLWMYPQIIALVSDKIKQFDIDNTIEYYHIELPNYFTDNILCDGTIVESFSGKQTQQLLQSSTSKNMYDYDDVHYGFRRKTIQTSLLRTN